MRVRNARPSLLAAMMLAAALLTARSTQAVAPPFPSTQTTLLNTDGVVPIPDNGSLISVMTFTGGGIVIDVDVYLELQHTNSQDLDVYLVSPSGTTIALTTDNGGGNDDVFRGTTFDDQAPGSPSAPNVRNYTYTNLVATGPIQPEEPLGKVVGEPANGPWALVVIDDAGGSTGNLRAWSLTISTVGALGPSSPTLFDGDAPKTINSSAGITSNAVVSGLGARLYKVTATVDVEHTNSGDLDIFLTSPSGTRIDLATNIGGGNDDVYSPATFDDQAGEPIGDLAMLPPSGTGLGTVTGEGALAAFIGQDPNGTWTLTVVDRTSTYNGRLVNWSLAIVTATACGDGSLDAGEVCDDGNQVDGDGCDSNCTPTACGNGVVSPGENCDDGNTASGDDCPSTCRNGEVSCDNCIDDDGDGQVDATDLACEPGAFELRSAVLTPGKGKLAINGVSLAFPSGGAGTPVAVAMTDGSGPVLCASLGALGGKGKVLSARGDVAGGTLTLKLTTKRGGTVALRGRGMNLGAADNGSVRVGITIGTQRFAVGGTFRQRGGKWVYP
jgi:cysteine-rich repeat protein